MLLQRSLRKERHVERKAVQGTRAVAWFAGCFLWMLFSPQLAVHAEDLETRVRELEAMVRALQERLAVVEGRAQAGADVDLNLVGRLDQVESKTSELADARKKSDWAERIKFSGDFRYRHEWIEVDDNRGGNRDQDRHRVRARLGVAAKVNDEIDVAMQLASGSQDPVSTNQTLDGAFSSKPVWLDLMYFDYHPQSVPGLKVIGGKMKNPFEKPVGNSDLIWDTDLRPEGLAVTYRRKFADRFDVNLRGAGYWVDERNTQRLDDIPPTIDTDDTSLWALQADVKFDLPIREKTYLKVGGGYYDYGNVKKKMPAIVGGAFGNFVTFEEGWFPDDMNLYEGFVEIGTPVFFEWPFTVFGHYVKNSQAKASDEDTGWLLGAKLGACKEPRSWEIVYNYRDLEADAVMGAFTDRDFIGGGTDGRGHKISFGYQLAKNWKLGVNYFNNKRRLADPAPNQDYERLQLDVEFKF